MEDYSRNLEKELSNYSVPNPFKQARKWQLLFVSDDGKTISVKKYKGLVITLLVILSVAVLFSCGLSFLYYKSLIEKKSLRLLVEKTTKSLNLVSQEKELLNTRLFFFDKGKKKNAKTVKDKKKDKALVLGAKNPQIKDYVKKKAEIHVSVTELLMTKKEDSDFTKIRFIIRNLTKLKRISGRVFIVLKPDLKNPQNWLTIPPVLLKDGEPLASAGGRFFSINNFKSMHFKFNDKNIDSTYQNMTVFIYSKAGEKIFESNYPVKVDLIKKHVVKEKKFFNSKKTSGAKPLSEEKKVLIEKIEASKQNGVATKTSGEKADKDLSKAEDKKAEIISKSEEPSAIISNKEVPENES